jgi:hypothetical protein
MHIYQHWRPAKKSAIVQIISVRKRKAWKGRNTGDSIPCPQRRHGLRRWRPGAGPPACPLPDPEPGKTVFCVSVLRIRDPVLFDPWIRDPTSGMEKKSRSGINIPDHISDSLARGTIFGSKMPGT